MYKMKILYDLRYRVAFIYLFEKFVLLQKDICVKYLYEQYFKEMKERAMKKLHS